MITIVQAQLPDDLVNAWAQHIRDFDAMHPGCHFEMIMQTEGIAPVRRMVELLKVSPELPIREVYEFAKKDQ